MSYSAELYVSFKRLAGVPATIAGLVLGLAAFFYVPDANVPWKYVIVAIVACFMSLAVLFDASLRLHTRSRSPLPRILRSLAPTPIHQESVALLLLEPSELFGQQAVVSIFCLKDGFEVLVALGVVFTVQEDKKIQVLVRQAIDENDKDLWRSVLNNDIKILQQLVIKPSMPANVPAIRSSNGRITE
jgi:hypothetical protein